MPYVNATTVPASTRVQQIFAGLLLMLGCVWLIWQFPQQQARQWDEAATQVVALEEQYYRLDQSQLAWLQSFTSAHFSAGGAQSEALVRVQIDAQLDSLFARVDERLPLFADWYYSLSGEYSRMAMAALSTTKLVEGDFLARKAAAVLFPDPVWQAGLVRLENEANAQVLTQQAQTRAQWLQEVESLLATQRVPAPIAGLPKPEWEANMRPLDDLLVQLSALESMSQFDERMAINSIGAASLAGPALWRAVAARNALGSARVLAAGTARTGSRAVGSRVGGAAAGALFCAPGGPVAIACAVGAGAVTWLASDWLLLQLDEAINRDQLMQHMRTALEDLRGGLEEELLSAYQTRIAATDEAAQSAITRSFSPRNN